jgi:hypothetical protein
MGASDVTAPAENGAGGGGEETQGNGLWDLSTVPEELRPHVEPFLKDFDRNANKKIQEQAEQLKRYQPFQEIEGLTDVPPDEMQALLELREIFSDEDTLHEWVQHISQELGIGGADLADEDSWRQAGIENGWLDDDGEGGGGGEEYTMEDIIAAVKEAIAPDIEPIRQAQEQQMTQAQIQEIERELQQQMSAIEEQHGALSEAQKEDIISLAQNYVNEDDPIAKGFEHYQRIRGGGQSDLVDDKLSVTNGTALNGGATDTTPQKTSWIDGNDPKELAKRRMAAQPR